LEVPAAPVYTAGLRPDIVASDTQFPIKGKTLFVILSILVVLGLGFRGYGLSKEGLSDDELNKYNAVEDYRQHGVTSANGEHPMLMKALITLSLVAADHWNSTQIAQSHPDELRISIETAIRLPSIVFGALTSLAIYFLVLELFGTDVALIAAALWAFDPSAIGFGRIGKEDTFVLFFFVLANVFWLRGQRVAELNPDRNPEPYYWATAAAYGAMIASKYLPHLIVVSLSYNYIFQAIPATRWRIGKRRFLIFFIVMGLTFLLCNPAIVLPDTWRQMANFAGYKRVGHDGYEFMGHFYSHRMMLWLSGVPWYFYFAFIAVKVPLATILGMLVGFPLLFRKRIGDGRFFMLFWMLFWFVPFSLMGGKFTRYFTVGYGAAIIIAAIGISYLTAWLARRVSAWASKDSFTGSLKVVLTMFMVLPSLGAAETAAPYYRLYMNPIGGEARAGYFFPHDEFYDGSIRDSMAEVARRAGPGARVVSETPELAAFYGRRAGRDDLVYVSLSDTKELRNLVKGDVIINARGRRYISNLGLLSALSKSQVPGFEVKLGSVPTIQVYLLDESGIEEIMKALP
jgi:hypothetical protein